MSKGSLSPLGDGTSSKTPPEVSFVGHMERGYCTEGRKVQQLLEQMHLVQADTAEAPP